MLMGCIIATCTVAGMWLSTLAFYAGLDWRTSSGIGYVHLGSGALSLCLDPRAKYHGFRCGRRLIPLSAEWHWRALWHHQKPGGFLIIVVPLWIPFLLFGVPSALLWPRGRMLAKGSRAGCCVRCGYDLSGLAAGSACPECGSGNRGRET